MTGHSLPGFPGGRLLAHDLIGKARAIWLWVAAGCLCGVLGLAPAAAVAAGPCDGASDATAALNAMLADGGQVRLPAGLCRISGSLHIVSRSVVIGSGIGRTVIKASPAPDYPVIAIGSPRGGASDIDLSGLTVDGSGTHLFEHPKDGVLAFAGSSHLRIHNIEAFGAGGNGIKVVGHDIEVSDNLVHDNYANGIYAIGDQRPNATVRTTDVRVLRNRVTHNSLAALPPAISWDGIALDSATANCLIASNTVIGNDIILFESTKFVPTSSGYRVLDNTVLGSPENGIDVGGAITDFVLAGNRIERTRGFGIVVNGPAARGTIRSNAIQGTTKQGILIDNWLHLPGVPRDIQIVGNAVDPGPSAGTAAAIAVRGGATDVSVTGNRIGAYGISKTGAGSGVAVQGNR